MAMMALGIIGVAGMVGSVGAAGYNSAHNLASIKQATTDLKNQTASMKAQWESATKSMDKIDAELRQQIDKNLEAIHQTIATINANKEDLNAQKKKIQTVGIAWVVVIFFLLLLKTVGILDNISDLLFAWIGMSSDYDGDGSKA